MILLTGLPVSAHTYSIIPYPKSLIPQEGEYIFKNEQKISFPTEISEVAKEFICRIKTVTGINLVTISESKKADISFTLQKNMANEAYKLYITPYISPSKHLLRQDFSMLYRAYTNSCLPK